MSTVILTRIFLGEDPKTSPMVRAGAKICTELLPKWDEDDGSIDMYYWHFATLALFQGGGKEWKSWSPHLRAALLANQRAGDGCDSGSWDPIGPWGRDGGRVYSTALNALTILTPWRFPGRGN